MHTLIQKIVQNGDAQSQKLPKLQILTKSPFWIFFRNFFWKFYFYCILRNLLFDKIFVRQLSIFSARTFGYIFGYITYGHISLCIIIGSYITTMLFMAMGVGIDWLSAIKYPYIYRKNNFLKLKNYISAIRGREWSWINFSIGQDVMFFSFPFLNRGV